MNVNITDIIGAVIIFLLGLLAYKVMPYISTKVSANQFGQIQKWIKIAVQAAEMIYKESGMGKEKKQYVIDFLEAHGFTIDFDELNNMIESAVLDMNLKK